VIEKQSFNPKYHATEDQMSVEQLQVEKSKNDPRFFAPIYNRYYKQIFSYVFQRMQDKEIASDVTAQVFLKALSNLHRYEFKGVPFASWLYRIAQSEVYQNFRDRKNTKTVNVDIGDLRFVFEEIEESIYEDYTPLVMKLVRELPEKDLKMVEMRFFEKRPFKEIADEFGITENNAKVRLYRLLEKIKKVITKK
ncbi:MAG: RNA polymerase sigma factor, partial [Bacteroidota bacterium]